MAGVRDPAFWKRFSMAVHLDEEKGPISDTQSTSTAASRPPLKHSDSWLERNRKKAKRTRMCGWVIAIIFLLIAAGVVFVVLWFLKTGPFRIGEPSSEKPEPSQAVR